MCRSTCCLVALICWLPASIAIGGQIIVQAPDGAGIASAQASTADNKNSIPASISGAQARFKDLLADTAYDISLTLADGTTLQGVDLGWYSIEPAKPGAGELSDDDKQQIDSILTQILKFTNKNSLLLLQGDHDRATALVQLVRDKPFHSDQGGEVIWRIELWYFQNRHGGWEKVQQTDKLLRRERFPSRQAYQDVVDHLRWTPALGGLKVTRDGAETTVKLAQPIRPARNAPTSNTSLAPDEKRIVPSASWPGHPPA